MSAKTSAQGEEKETTGSPLAALLSGERLHVPRALVVFAIIVPILISLFHFFAGWYSGIDPLMQRKMVLYLILIGTFVLYPLGRKRWSDPLNWFFAIDVLIIMVVVAVGIYTFWDAKAMELRITHMNNADLFSGVSIIILTLEACRRTIGWPLPIICTFLLLQNLFGEYLPGILFGPSYSIQRIVETMFVNDLGLFGVVMRIMTNYLILFYVFAAFLKVSGAGEMFNNLAFAVAGRYSGGPAKAAIVASAFFGTLSGSPISNVLATGSFTIPMMKKLGYKPHWAGAIEAVASTGGSFTPPMMGATVFILAEFLGESYWMVCLAVIIPCLLYYIALFSQVHFEGIKLGLRSIPKEELPTIKSALLGGWPVWLVIALVFFLLSRSYGLAYVAFYAVLALIALSFLNKKTRMGPQAILTGFEDGGRMAISIGSALAAAGIVVGTLEQTGLADTVARMIVTGSAGSLPVALVICAFVCLILGMGLPVVIIYVTVFVAAIPALIKMGVEPVSAHLFCYMWGVVHSYTPPFAPVAFAASGVAGSGPMRTGLTASRLGIAAYLVPFAFVFSPALVGRGSALDILWTASTAAIGFVAIGSGISGYFIRNENILERGLLLLGGILLFIPEGFSDLIGAALVAIAVIWQFRGRSRMMAGEIDQLQGDQPEGNV